MRAYRGVVQHGRIHLEEGVVLPEGAVVTVTIGEAQVTVTFNEPQRAVTPGQFVVFYDGPRCLGGAVIEAASGMAAGLRPAVSA